LRDSKLRKGSLSVPNDAKLGLVAGVAIVLVVALVFYRDEAGVGVPLSTGSVAANQTSKPLASSENPADQHSLSTRPTVQIQAIDKAAGAAKQPGPVPDDLE
jgi:hypothetical protein